MASASRVLVVEDERAIGQLLGRVLGERGFAVDTLADGAAAVRRLGQVHYDLLVLDIHLPGTSGWEVLRKRQELARPPVTIVMSGVGDASAAERARQHGAHDFLAKPFSLEDFSRCLESLPHLRTATSTGSVAPVTRARRRRARRTDLACLIDVAAASNAATAVVDTHDRVVAWNEAAAALLGWLPSEASGRTLEDLVGLVEMAPPVGACLALRHKDGRALFLDTSRVAMNGGACWLFRPGRARAEEALIRRLGGEWWSASHAVLLLGEGGAIVRANVTAEDLCGHALPATLAEIGAVEPWLSARAALERLGGAGDVVEATARSADGKRSWEVVAGSAPDAPLCALVLVESTRLERLATGLDDRVTLTTLVAGLAHEVRNPLFSISATIDALEAQLGTRPAGRDEQAFIEHLRTSVRRLAQLTSDLIELGRPIELDPSARAVEPLLTQAVAACVPLAQAAGVTLEPRVAGPLGQVRSSGTSLHQVLVNLLQNAVQHSAAGQTVLLTAANVSDGGATWVELAVEDRGPGIDAAVLGRLFQPFFSRRRGGTGLGLAIARRIALAHGGSLAAGNRPDGGARFRLRLPSAAGTDP
jgi:signal transduction histidine kinase/DNA-binding response OmpR family regulator